MVEQVLKGWCCIMELKNNNYTENIEEIDGEMIGRKLLLPQCVKCVHSDGARCAKYNALKVDLGEQGIDIFHCPSFEAKKDSPTVEKIKAMGFSEE